MNKYDLSILIPARNEMFVSRTVADILEHKRGKTEIIVALDGQWADPQIPDHKDVTIIYFPEAIGQRAATNQACRLSRAKYVMKLDAHCSLDEGFDVKLMEDMQDDFTMVPVMRNLHAFDWVCPKCKSRHYQGPSETYKKCECGGEREKEILWFAKPSPQSTSFRFDKTLHFQYFGEYKKVQDASGSHLVESMSLQGSCFMLTREKYWKLNICDENSAGKSGWGQQGVEVALKTWLSGGRVIVNKKTWYAHMFRTQGGDFSFPYPLSGSDVDKARKFSQDLWLNNKWDKAIHDLKWLIHKFAPVPEWEDVVSTGKNIEPSKGIIFYTDNQLNLKIAHAVQKQLKKMNLPIVSASLKPMSHFGKNIHIPLPRGIDTYFQQIISALENLTTDIVFFCEHDVLYHPSHFTFTPERNDMFYYNQNFWRVRSDGFAVHFDANQVSGLVCYRKYALDWYKKRYQEIKEKGFNRSYEPGGRDSKQYQVFFSEYPNVDIRHDSNLTRSKWSPDDFRDKSTCKNWQEGRVETIPGWNFPKENYLSTI